MYNLIIILADMDPHTPQRINVAYLNSFQMVCREVSEEIRLNFGVFKCRLHYPRSLLDSSDLEC